MFELIWGLLNGIFLIYFIIICLKSVKLLKEKIGILAALIFVIFLLSLISKSNEKNITEKNIEILNQTNPTKAFDGNSFYNEITLEEHLTSKIGLSIFVGENKTTKALSILNANSNRTGFIFGTNWNAKNIDIDLQKDQNYCNYSVFGILEWKILGFTIYSENKTFKGNALLKE